MTLWTPSLSKREKEEKEEQRKDQAFDSEILEAGQEDKLSFFPEILEAAQEDDGRIVDRRGEKDSGRLLSLFFVRILPLSEAFTETGKGDNTLNILPGISLPFLPETTPKVNYPVSFRGTGNYPEGKLPRRGTGYEKLRGIPSG